MQQLNWLLIAEICYFLLVLAVCIRIVYDTRTSTKTLAYLLMAIFVPLAGIIIYFSFGINYRKRKMYSKKLVEDEALFAELQRRISYGSEKVIARWGDEDQGQQKIARLLVKDGMSPLTLKNEVKLLVNGEEKFPAVLEALQAARHHIHIAYYIYEDDEIGNTIKDILIQKAQEGVEVRFMYDDFGSNRIGRKLVPALKAAGVEAYPFYKIHFWLLANRLNYRNHRKMIIIDGQQAFVGGINISDRYANGEQTPLYWRDTHLMIRGSGIFYLQYLFFCDWNFCAETTLLPEQQYFRYPESDLPDTLVQIAASGPDSSRPTIMLSILEAIYAAREELLITTPYFIPGDGILDALTSAALGGVRVRLLVPGISDSIFVNLAAKSYYEDLLEAGVEIYRYKKGFIHAKTMVVDRSMAMVGTANMDYRSFELNFEVNAILYNTELATQLAAQFETDIQEADHLESARWLKRSRGKQLLEKTARLLSPLL